MRGLFAAIAFLAALHSMAASVEWGVFALAETGPGTFAIGYTGNAVHANTSVQIRTMPHGGMLNIAESDTYLASFTAWAVAMAGEIVNAEMLRDASRLFYRNDGIQANQPFDVDYESDSFYLAFETSVWQDEEMSGAPQTEYGWVNVGVASGRLSIIDSAMGLKGQSMITGGGTVPEPASGMMVMLGIAALALRRKRD